MPSNQQTARIAGVVLCIYVVALFVGTHLPGSVVEDLVSGNDKIEHFLAYTGLGLLAFIFMFYRFGGLLWYFPLLFLSLAAFAALDELTQNLVPGRYSSWGDWWTDMAGVTVALACVAGWAHYRRYRLERRMIG